MFRACMLLAALCASAAGGTAPSYSADQIVSGANFVAGPVAPNSIVSVFGTNLAWADEAVTAEMLLAGFLPNHLGDVAVYIADQPTPLFYVCPTQINFLVPGNLRTGKYPMRVARQGVTGPEVTLTVVEAAPQLFQSEDGYAVAQHADFAQITTANPAHPGEIVVVYAAGLGRTQPNPVPGEIPAYAALMANLSSLRVSVGGTLVPPGRIPYAGITPGWPGLYQINLFLPDNLELNPELRVTVGDQITSAGAKIAVRPQ